MIDNYAHVQEPTNPITACACLLFAFVSDMPCKQHASQVGLRTIQTIRNKLPSLCFVLLKHVHSVHVGGQQWHWVCSQFELEAVVAPACTLCVFTCSDLSNNTGYSPDSGNMLRFK